MAHEKEPSSPSQNPPEQRGLLYILLSAFAFLFGWSSARLSAPKQDVCKTIHPQDTPDEEHRPIQIRSPVIAQIPPTAPQHNESNRRKDDRPAWEKWAAIIIAAGTLGLLVINGIQLSITRNQIHVGQRAYLLVETPVFETALQPDQEFRIHADIFNSGQTPAKNARGIGYIQVLKSEPEKIVYGREFPIRAIGANQKGEIEMTSSLNAAQVQEVIAKTMEITPGKFKMTPHDRLYFFGVVHYETVFGDTGEVEFCSVLKENEFILCGSHNGMK